MKIFGLMAGIILAGSTFGATVEPSVLKNYQAVEGSIYRGAQPDEDGFRELARRGIHTVIDLRGSGGRSTKEAALVSSLGMQYINIPLDGFQAPTADQVSKLLTLLEDEKTGPVFVHCRRGADRTGTILALYRIEHDHWENQKALDEAKSMKMASSERLMRNLILSYKPAVAGATL